MHSWNSCVVGNDHGLAGPSGASSRWAESVPAKRWGSRSPREGTLRRPLMAVKNESRVRENSATVAQRGNREDSPTQGTTSLRGLK